MDTEEIVNENSAQKDAPTVEKETTGGGSIEMQVDTMTKESGWQEVRSKRAEKRAQGGSTGASPAKPDAQRRAVEAAVGGSSALVQKAGRAEAEAATRDESNEQGEAEEEQQTQQRQPTQAAFDATRRARQVGGSIAAVQIAHDASTSKAKSEHSDSEESMPARDPFGR